MAKKVNLEIVTPARIMATTQADMVVVPGGGGNFGVLPGHAPLLSTMRPGLVEIYEGAIVKRRIFVEGGFADVGEKRCTVLAEKATPLAEISREEAEERLNKARARLESAETTEDRRDAGRELTAAEAMLDAVELREKELRQH